MKTYAPRTPSRRHMTGINYRELLTGTMPTKSLLVGHKRHMGRNGNGRITVRHKGGGSKRLLRLVDFFFDKKNIIGKVVSVEYDPNRSGFIGLIVYTDGEKPYIFLNGS